MTILILQVRLRWAFLKRNCGHTGSDFHFVWNLVRIAWLTASLTYLWLTKAENNRLLTSVFNHTCKHRELKPISLQQCSVFTEHLLKSVLSQAGRDPMCHSSPSSDQTITTIPTSPRWSVCKQYLFPKTFFQEFIMNWDIYESLFIFT